MHLIFRIMLHVPQLQCSLMPTLSTHSMWDFNPYRKQNTRNYRFEIIVGAKLAKHVNDEGSTPYHIVFTFFKL